MVDDSISANDHPATSAKNSAVKPNVPNRIWNTPLGPTCAKYSYVVIRTYSPDSLYHCFAWILARNNERSI